MKLPFEIDLKDKVVVVTGAGGIICSYLAKAIAQCGAKVALLDLNKAAAQVYVDEMVSEGLVAKAYGCNVLDKESLEACHQEVLRDFGKCDILVNGAGGNNARANTDNEFYQQGDLGKMKTFFDLDQKGVEFVFSLNYMGTLLPSQVFAQDMV